jgi:hypothetical protein
MDLKKIDFIKIINLGNYIYDIKLDAILEPIFWLINKYIFFNKLIMLKIWYFKIIIKVTN